LKFLPLFPGAFDYGKSIPALKGAERPEGSAGSCSAGKIESIGRDFALYIKGHIHLESILYRFSAPSSFGVFAELGNT